MNGLLYIYGLLNQEKPIVQICFNHHPHQPSYSNISNDQHVLALDKTLD